MEDHGILIPKVIDGTPGRIRTCDLLLRRQPLYPSELQAHMAENKSLNQNYRFSMATACGDFVKTQSRSGRSDFPTPLPAI
jgi:hypothetical protein